MDSLQQATGGEGGVIGTWISIGHPTVAEAVASVGLDFVLIDTEHTTMTLETVENMCRGVDAAQGDTQAIIRVPWNDAVTLKRVVDIGVAGVMVPMVETAEEAHRIVDAIRYPPEGTRGIAGSRATNYGLDFEEYVKNANGSITAIAQIETERALDNVAEIASVEGIDALFVGPSDLSGALGLFGERESDEYQRALERVVAESHEANTPVGTLTVDEESVQAHVDQGFDYLIVGKDTSQLISATRGAVDTYKGAIEDRSTPENH